jgi:hypothetical protein
LWGEGGRRKRRREEGDRDPWKKKYRKKKHGVFTVSHSQGMHIYHFKLPPRQRLSLCGKYSATGFETRFP